MAVNIGDVSGCLEVIPFGDDYKKEIKERMRPVAEREWNKDRYCFDGFFSEYNLTDKEIKAYQQKEKMPDSFIDKYLKRCLRFDKFEEPFLCKEGKNSTKCFLSDAIRKKRLIKVRCKKCGREFYTDEYSFSSTKWQKCLKIECDKSQICQKEVDYTKSLYEWDESSTELQVLNTQLAKVNEITKPLTYYNSLRDGFNKTSIAYISDIHLLHHLSKNVDMKTALNDICKNLKKSAANEKTLLFNGDIASDPKAVLLFFKQFILQYVYADYKKFLETLHSYQNIASRYLVKENGEYRFKENYYRTEALQKLENYLSTLYEELYRKCGFDWNTFEKYKNRYQDYCSYLNAFSAYKNTNGYKKQGIEKSKEEKIEQFIGKIEESLKIKKGYEQSIIEFRQKIERTILRITVLEEEKGVSIDNINVAHYKYNYNLKENFGVTAIVILGNHEFIEFPDIQSGVNFYKEALEKMGIKVLFNEYVNLSNKCDDKESVVLYGGTGFAKYNLLYNADNIVCCHEFTREDEIKETEAFEKGYREALEYAKQNDLTFICASHYPVDSCLNNHYDNETIYFTGHNHRNEYAYKEGKALYADNQIGYKNPNIYFKIADIGLISNPYSNLPDGLYETTIDTYLKFYRYLGESIGEGAILYKKCANSESNLYVIKHKGYYGFFIVTSKGNGTVKGIFIANGGSVKKISNSTNISWICENFDIVLAKYLQMLIPLRTAQEELAQELKELGLSGKIHGTIVDIDFYHHIMINIQDGTVTFYFSPIFGWAEKLDTFDDVIQSLKEKSSRMVDKELYRLRAKKSNYLLAQISNNNIYMIEEKTSKTKNNSLEIVSRSEGVYGVSKKVNSLQRIFDGKVLRDFDIRLTETQSESYRKNLLIGRQFYYNGTKYEIAEDDGSDIIFAIEVTKENTALAKTKCFSVVDLVKRIKSRSIANNSIYWVE